MEEQEIREQMTKKVSAEDVLKGTSAVPTGKMTARERFLRCMHFQTVDHVPHMEFGYWDSTILNFHQEGLPEKYANNAQVEGYFGCQQLSSVPVNIGVKNTRKQEIVEDKGDVQIIRDPLGVLAEKQKGPGGSIPHYLEFPIRDMETCEAFIEEFLPIDPENRIPENLDELAEAYRHRDYPLAVPLGSFMGWIRNWIGFENIALMFYDNPEVIDKLVERICRIAEATLPLVLKKVDADCAAGWEDICFNSGPICSPDMFKQFVIPRLKRVIKVIRQHGIDIIFTDCDGKINDLVPLWLDAGLNCMFPVEVHAGTDPVELRDTYGHDILMLGGFDKMKLLKGKEAVLEELKRLEPVIEDGGFIPHVDHRVQADVKYDVYCYYIREKLNFLGVSDEEISRIEAFKK